MNLCIKNSIFMNTTSVMRSAGSAVLAFAFAFAPALPLYEAFQMPHILSVPVAEAETIETGIISGIVRVGTSAVNTNPGVQGITIKLYVGNEAALAGETLTGADGRFAFSAPQGITYKAVLMPALGYAPIGNTSEITSTLGDSFVISDFTLKKLPKIAVLGANPVVLPVGARYVDPGVQLQDATGAKISGYPISATNTIDANKAGEYTVSYSVEEKAFDGYSIPTAVRTVKVVSKTSYVDTVAAKTPLVTTTNTQSCTYLNAYLGKGMSNDKFEVLKLQAFLFFKEGSHNVKATGVFDDATEIAVRNFQDKYYQDVLTPWGSDDNTGAVRLTTQKKINDIFCGITTQFNKAQESALLSYRTQSIAGKARVISNEVPLVLNTAKPATITQKITSWWNKAKEGLVAAFPFFKKNETAVAGDMASATPASVAEKIVNTGEKVDNLASTNSTKASGMSTITTIISLVLGILAFGVAFYLYRRTRGPAAVLPVTEPVHVEVKKK